MTTSQARADAEPVPPAPDDDLVLPFSTRQTGVTGRLVRLGSVVDEILKRHDYPDSVSVALGEALVLASLLGSALKFDGQLTLQTKTSGPLGLLVADYTVPGHLRAYAGLDAERFAQMAASAGAGTLAQSQLLGDGYLAMTIDPRGDMDRYQGIVALDGVSLIEAAHTYFRQSEQLPTLIRVAVAREFAQGGWHWRAGGLLVQQVARGGGAVVSAPTLDEERDALLEGEDDADWTRIRILAGTVEDHELIDPSLAPLRLLFRLFHEEGVTARAPTPLIARCRCSRERLLGYLQRFDRATIDELREADGQVSAKCEFCSTVYKFGDADSMGAEKRDQED